MAYYTLSLLRQLAFLLDPFGLQTAIHATHTLVLVAASSLQKVQTAAKQKICSWLLYPKAYTLQRLP